MFWLVPLLLWVPQDVVLFTNDDAHLLVRNAPSVARFPAKCVWLTDGEWTPPVVLVMARNRDDACIVTDQVQYRRVQFCGLCCHTGH